MRYRGEVGIKDVAKAAGVSVGTVSNVLNRPEVVSPARRAEVQRVIAELGYVPNHAARQLKAGISRSVGMIVADTQNPFYGVMIRGAEAAAEELGLGLFVANSQYCSSKEEFYLSQFEMQRFRGVLLVPLRSGSERHRAMAARGARIVLADVIDPDENFCTVATDDFHGGYLAITHLTALGRRRIHVVGEPGCSQRAGRRYEGALAAAMELGGVQLTYMEPSEASVLAGRSEGERIASLSGDQRPEAVFAMNDLLAVGVLQALVLRGAVAVPDDIALVGYGDIGFCTDAVVPLTSIRQPGAEMGRKAMELLGVEVAEGQSHRHAAVLLKPELIARESTAGARGPAHAG